MLERASSFLAPSEMAQKSTKLSAHADRIVQARAACERAGRDDDARKLDGERRVRAQARRLQGAPDEQE